MAYYTYLAQEKDDYFCHKIIYWIHFLSTVEKIGYMLEYETTRIDNVYLDCSKIRPPFKELQGKSW